MGSPVASVHATLAARAPTVFRLNRIYCCHRSPAAAPRVGPGKARPGRRAPVRRAGGGSARRATLLPRARPPPASGPSEPDGPAAKRLIESSITADGRSRSWRGRNQIIVTVE